MSVLFPHQLLLLPIRQIRTHLPLGFCGVLLQVVGDADVQQGILPCLLPPEQVRCREFTLDETLSYHKSQKSKNEGLKLLFDGQCGFTPECR